MHGDPRCQHDTVLHVDGTVGKGGYQQLVPTGPEQKYLILQWQRRKMRDVFRPCYQLEQLFVRGVANVRHCILCIARDAELIGAFSWNSYARPFHENISSRRRCSYVVRTVAGKKLGRRKEGASFPARVRTNRAKWRKISCVLLLSLWVISSRELIIACVSKIFI